MQNFKQMRENMVDCQIHPMGVASEDILDAFASVPREAFVPENLQSVAYCDEDIEVCEGRYLLEPSVMARMLQYAKPASDDVALTIGSGAGYTAALLSKIVSTVVSLEEDPALIEKSQAVWDEYSFCNIVGLSGVLTEGAPKNAPYSLIIINGCVSTIPDSIKAQLAPNGRMLAIIQSKDEGIGRATLIECNGKNEYSSRVLFDASTPYLSGFEPCDNFEF
ncbi:MAG: protein-L-isoaspartate family protein [Micavibrio sp.]|nr:protein-L-isoaspartate family protein [Micavibrio sp.]